jgi:hypothetical protein
MSVLSLQTLSPFGTDTGGVVTPSNAYVAEDNATFYVDETGAVYYVQET